PNTEHGNDGDEVIELAPDANALTQCPTDDREVEVDGVVTKSVSIAEGAKVSFAVSLSNPGADNPYEFEWIFGDGQTTKRTMEPGLGSNYHWPERAVEHQYPKTAGVYHAIVRIYGSFGTSEVPIEVTVGTATPPKAEFAPPAGAAEEAVKFDASA